jgi:hypothetical protein
MPQAIIERPQQRPVSTPKAEPPKTDPKLTEATIAHALDLVRAGKVSFSSTVIAKGLQTWRIEAERAKLDMTDPEAAERLAELHRNPEWDDSLAVFTADEHVAAFAVVAALKAKGDALPYRKLHDAITGKPEVGEPVVYIPYRLTATMALDRKNYCAAFIAGTNEATGLANIAFFDPRGVADHAISVPPAGELRVANRWFRR